MLDDRKGKTYIVDRAGYGDITIMREYNYGNYYVIDYTRDAQLIPADLILIKDLKRCEKEHCRAVLNENFQSYIEIKLLYGTNNRYKAYDYFHQLTGARRGTSYK